MVDKIGTPRITPSARVGDRPAQPDWTQRVAADEKPRAKPAPQRDEFVATGKAPAPQEALVYDRSAWHKKPGIDRDKEGSGNGSGMGDGNAAGHPTVSIHTDGQPVRRIFGRDDSDLSR